MGQVAAVVKSQRQYSVSWVQDGLVSRKIGLRATVGLYIDMVVSIEYFSPHIAGIFLKLVYKFSASIVTAGVAGSPYIWIAFGVFPAEAAPAGGQYGF